MTPNRWDVVEVEWYDAIGEHGGGNSATFIAQFKPCIRRTLGYWLGERLDYVFICETDDRDAQTQPDDIERINAIYLPMVKSIKLFPKGKHIALDDEDEE